MTRVGIFARAWALAVCVAVACAGGAIAAPSPIPSTSPSPSGSPTPTPTPVPTAKPVYQSMSWREIGPALPGGRVANVAGSARNPNLYYLGSAGGGVWKTTNAGLTWTAVFAKEKVASIGDVVVDPNDDATVWVGTGEDNPRNDVIAGGGVYKSTDAGKTWKNVGLEKTRTISRILVDPRDSKHVIVAAQGNVFAPSEDRGVYVTDDGGATWTKTLYLSQTAGASDIALDPQHPNVVYAGMWHFVRKPWTTNSGGDDDGLYRSADGGRTWTRLTGHGLPDGTTGRIGLAISPTTGRIYALIESNKGILWRSDDAGANWSLVSSDTLVDQRPFYFSHLYVDPGNADHAYGLSASMSSTSDGGKTWRIAPGAPHGDFHGMWIAPNDPKRMIVSEDGGIGISLDGGRTWAFSRNVPIGEVYHVGVGAKGNPYDVCGGWQDNNAWCGPAFTTDPSGIPNSAWVDVAGGDGEWAIPDPIDPDWLWADSQQGFVSVFNRKTKDQFYVLPYVATNEENFDLRTAKYRFNWDTPIAFAPWDGHIAWLGGNVVFQTTDRGRHWKAISPDLTLNEKDHQAPPGGPITHDVSSAENYDTILDIEGSPRTKDEIWVGTDDGQVQLTRDGGRHWKNVTPKGLPDHGEFETVAPSAVVAGTVYASMDRHLLGDDKPYLYVTHDYGATWTSIAKGLPDTSPARSVRADLKNRDVVYAGTETGLWLSCDGGSTWNDFKNELPTVAVRDMRFQSTWNDLAIATHGRSLYIMDDMRPLQLAGCAAPKEPFVLAPRTTYEYNLHGDNEGTYTDYAGQNPPFGVVVTYYQPTPSATPPVIKIYDAKNRLVRTVQGDVDIPFAPPGAKPHPWISNDAGLQTFVWDFTRDGPVKWNGAGKFFKGPNEGAGVAPGRYVLQMRLHGRTFTEPFEIKADPNTVQTQAEIEAAVAYNVKYLQKFSDLDVVLNHLDDVKTQLDADRAAAAAKNDATTVAAIDAALAGRQTLQDSLTANYQNFEDFILRSGRLREDLSNAGTGLAVPSVLAYGTRVDAAYAERMSAYAAFVRSLVPLAASLKQGGYPELKVPAVK